MPTLLFAEDDQAIRNVFAFALTHEGFAVTLVDNGAAALEKAQEQSFDVMVLDMMMMGGSGLDFLRSYNVKKLAPQTVVLAFTNIDNPKIEAEARALGVAAYLNKSQFEPLQLVETIKKLLVERPRS